MSVDCVGVSLGCVSRGVSEGYVCERELGLCECGPATLKGFVIHLECVVN